MFASGIIKSGSSSFADTSGVGFSRVGQSFMGFIVTGISISMSQLLLSFTFKVMVAVPNWFNFGVKVTIPLASVVAVSKLVAVCVNIYIGVNPSSSLISAP